MPEKKDQPKQPPPKAGYISKPPSKADLDQVSRDQALISDDWTGEAAGQPAPEDGGKGHSPG